MALALARSLRLAARRVKAPVGLIRCFAKKADAGEANTGGSLSNADITKYFLDLDSSSTAAAGSDLPIKLTGRSGELVTELYATVGKGKGAFDKTVKELHAACDAVTGGGLVVERFFSNSNYSPEECKMVAELLLTSKEPLASFESIKSADVKDLLVDNESNMEAWKGARKVFSALSPEVKKVVEALAEEGRLDLVKKVASKAAELSAATSKTVDAVVSSAVALSKEQQAAISKALPAYAPSGSSLNVVYSVDPAVLGGLLVSMGNQTIDLTASTRLVDVAQRKLQ